MSPLSNPEEHGGGPARSTIGYDGGPDPQTMSFRQTLFRELLDNLLKCFLVRISAMGGRLLQESAGEHAVVHQDQKLVSESMKQLPCS